MQFELRRMNISHLRVDWLGSPALAVRTRELLSSDSLMTTKDPEHSPLFSKESFCTWFPKVDSVQQVKQIQKAPYMFFVEEQKIKGGRVCL